MPPLAKVLPVRALTRSERQQRLLAKQKAGMKITLTEYHGIIGERHDGFLLQYSNGNRPWPPYWVPKAQPPQDAIINWLQARLDGEVTQISEDPPFYRLTSYITSPPMFPRPQSLSDEAQHLAKAVEALCQAQLERELNEFTYRRGGELALKSLQAQVARNRRILLTLNLIIVAILAFGVATMAGCACIGVPHLY